MTAVPLSPWFTPESGRSGGIRKWGKDFQSLSSLNPFGCSHCPVVKFDRLSVPKLSRDGGGLARGLCLSWKPWWQEWSLPKAPYGHPSETSSTWTRLQNKRGSPLPIAHRRPSPPRGAEFPLSSGPQWYPFISSLLPYCFRAPCVISTISQDRIGNS